MTEGIWKVKQSPLNVLRDQIELVEAKRLENLPGR